MREDRDKIQEARFLSLVLSLYNSAWIALGKIANPLTGKVEKDLDAVRGTIDLLETLSFKTKGNVTPEEKKVLDNCLSALQMNYVEEISRKEKGEAGKEEPKKEEKKKGEAPKEEPKGKEPEKGEAQEGEPRKGEAK